MVKYLAANNKRKESTTQKRTPKERVEQHVATKNRKYWKGT